ncbi:hypothetical protein HPB48_010637 [Haemaphysalis longicornis]|uniref:Uncharacterized protein n=1 Tax=Haemaphysalis longicornis TaxID=44386 RepID=A0A9J6FPS4_HAELO|nr:hypothetical protein HPB48_010637 [Haemaphysalis longicornis]
MHIQRLKKPSFADLLPPDLSGCRDCFAARNSAARNSEGGEEEKRLLNVVNMQLLVGETAL